jgi:aminomethyltransferase
MESLKSTPFHRIHAALGARMVPFAGFEMPVHYPAGITAEHKAVRERVGLFDVSHMGEFIIGGPGAVAFLNRVTTNDVGALAIGQAHYSAILNDRGTFVDDCLVYRYPDYLMLVVNASNAAKDLRHISQQRPAFECTIADMSDHTALLALQGPQAASVLQPLTEVGLAEVRYYHFMEGAVAGVQCTISRTGYTGEDGFELYFRPDQAETVWNALTAGGGVTPCGLGCRDSLRLEMGMALYGNDIDDSVTPLEANLGWIVKMNKADFLGRAALEQQKAAGVKRKLVGFTTAERSFPRHGYPVFANGEPSGMVCSGTMSPTLGIPIGTCYLPVALTSPGSQFGIEIRGKRVAAEVVKMPFHAGGSHL